jgi:aspartate/methionine/tyrosine aminotransferase
MREAYRVRRDELLEILDRVGLPASRPSGAFYVWTAVRRRSPRLRNFTRVEVGMGRRGPSRDAPW